MAVLPQDVDSAIGQLAGSTVAGIAVDHSWDRSAQEYVKM
jgi:hypothetical protein